jgi:hypothetical protein
MTKLIRAEIIADAEEYGDARRTRIVERAAAQAIEPTDLLANEPVTIVLSTGGFARAAKGTTSIRVRSPTRPVTRSRQPRVAAAPSRHCSLTPLGVPIRCRRTACLRPAARVSRSRADSTPRTVPALRVC